MHISERLRAATTVAGRYIVKLSTGESLALQPENIVLLAVSESVQPQRSCDHNAIFRTPIASRLIAWLVAAALIGRQSSYEAVSTLPSLVPWPHNILKFTIFGMKSIIFGMKSTIASTKSTMFCMKSVIFGMKSTMFCMKSVIFGMKSVISS